MKKPVESGTNKKLNVLILSSFMPVGSPKMVLDMYKALSTTNDVDLLLKYPMESKLNVLSVYNTYERFLEYGLLKLNTFFSKIKNKLSRGTIIQHESKYHFFGIDDAHPPVATKKILNQIQKEYDFILVFFWQGMISAKTLFDIYQKTKKPILLFAADMFPMTGGCSYFWDCTNLTTSCGKCPGLNSSDENDSTRQNFLYKKDKLSAINTVFLGNSWMNNYAAQSGLFKHIEKAYPIIDENIFKPLDKAYVRKQKNYSNKKILFFGAVQPSEDRKGYTYLIEALKLLKQKRPDLADNIVLLVAGNNVDLPELEDFEVKQTGYLTFEELAECYAMSDIFLSPSIQDAGPMMLNQSLLCGTPAVAFNMGTACDIINSDTGYLAKYRDSVDFCHGIIGLLDKSEIELENISKECRRQSMGKYSYDAFRENMVRIYNKIK
ncbi:glycosyltransferase [Flavobacterium agrisoli]|uniref:Glycosyltransferase n=1 Tax=Flavobacterium agrisoli TaxID=2793066 RepID=A0A934PRI3_9FLAO|nr:glycosyltransferase [Flavobacterium agrisoli]MBK0371271.1 glycosyltransferase [Flavobacterium agrisoli]